MVMVVMMGTRRWRRRWRWRHFRFVHVELSQQRRVELVKVLWHRVWVHFNVRETLGVTLEMDLEVALGGEPVTANVALERSLARVRSNVNLQSRVATEHFAAITATMFEKLILFAATGSTGTATVTVSARSATGMAASRGSTESVAES